MSQHHKFRHNIEITFTLYCVPELMTKIRHHDKKVRHSVKTCRASWRKKCVMSSKLPWHQNVRHDVNECNILQKVSYDVTNTSTHVNDIKNTPWRHKICHDIRCMSKQCVMKSKTCHNIDTFAMTSKTRHSVNKYVKKVRHDVKNISWRQQICHDVKMLIKNMAWWQRVCHDVKRLA